TKEVTKGIEKYENLKRKHNKEEEKEWQEIIKKHEKTIKQREREKELKNEIISYGKGKGKEVRKEVEAAHLALKYGAEVREYRKDKEILTNQISRIEIEKGQLKNDIVGLQGNIKTKNIEIKNLTNSRDEARNERDTAREELGKFKLEKIQWVHDKKRLEEERDEAVRTMESLGYPK